MNRHRFRPDVGGLEGRLLTTDLTPTFLVMSMDPAPTDPTMTGSGTTILPPDNTIIGPDPIYNEFLNLTDVLSNPWM